jgi:hypothetical protein
MGIRRQRGVFKFERNIGTEAMKYLSLLCLKVPGEQKFAKVRPTKCSKMFDEEKKIAELLVRMAVI